MRFFQSLFAGAALVAAAAALEINNFPKTVEAGKSYEITYSPADNTPTTFLLRQGANENLMTVATLTESATGGKFTWSVASSLPNGADYALEIKQASTSNYIGPIALSGGTTPTSSAASSAASSSAASSSAASSASSAASSSAASTTSSAASATLTTSASASVSTSGVNSTITTATLSATGSAKPTGSQTTSSGPPESTGAASGLGSSPLALVFGAVAAMAYLN